MSRNETTSPGPAPADRLRVALYAALAATAAAVGAATCAQGPQVESPATPAPRVGAWVRVHDAYVERAARGGVDLLFLGDSITQNWNGRDGEGHGPVEIWDRYYAPRRAANFGIGGDRTQHVLWRLDHGELDGIDPEVVVLLIGTNNLNSDTPPEIADGVTAIVRKLRDALPNAKVLLLAVFPRGKSPDTTRERLKAVNARLARLDDGRNVRYLDLGPEFLDADGTLPADVMPDFLHLSRKGYQTWAEAMEPTLWEMFEGR